MDTCSLHDEVSRGLLNEFEMCGCSIHITFLLLPFFLFLSDQRISVTQSLLLVL